jgi:2-keto-3-deoxy-L-rhamnonate aldolase RhmA
MDAKLRKQKQSFADLFARQLRNGRNMIIISKFDSLFERVRKFGVSTFAVGVPREERRKSARELLRQERKSIIKIK